MPAQLTATANDILNRVATEVGLETVTDPVASTDKSFIRLEALLNIAGEELSQNYPWEFLIKEHTFDTDSESDGEYDLPSDFLYMVNQTGWDRTNDRPLMGPLSPQEWQYLIGTGQNGTSVNIAYRFNEGVLKIINTPVPSNTNVYFEYVSRNWVLDSTTGNTYRANIGTGADTPQFDRTLLSRFLKVKWLESQGFDTTKAQADLNQSFMLMTTRERGAPVLDAGRGAYGMVYLGYRNIPDSNYGT